MDKVFKSFHKGFHPTIFKQLVLNLDGTEENIPRDLSENHLNFFHNSTLNDVKNQLKI